MLLTIDKLSPQKSTYARKSALLKKFEIGRKLRESHVSENVERAELLGSGIFQNFMRF